MLNCSSQPLSSRGRLLNFLNLNPPLFQMLLSGCDHDLNEVTTIIEPVFQASERCNLTPFYIYAVSLGRIAFLATNLGSSQGSFSVTSTATSWSVGRSPASGVHISHRTVSRCHAVVSHHSFSNFFITDLGSCNGTWVNDIAIAPHKREIVRDGDVIRFGSVCAEFFSLIRCREHVTVQDTTYG